IAVRTILGQQISVRGATTMATRLCERFGRPVDTGRPHLSRLTPTAIDLAAATANDLTQLGLIRTRAETVLALARGVCQGEIRLGAGVPIDEAKAALARVPGIGPWTVEVIAMRALGFPDAFPASDLGVMKALVTSSPKDAALR